MTIKRVLYEVRFLFSGFVKFEILGQILINLKIKFNAYPFSIFRVVTLTRRTEGLEDLKINRQQICASGCN
jgi:hypothetical protein